MNDRFKLEAVDKDFVEEFLRCLSKVMGRSYKMHKKGKGTWVARGYGKALIDFMKEPLDHHKPIIESYPSDFLRGFFDGEGCVTEITGKKYTYGRVGASNTNLRIIEYIKTLLQEKFSLHPTLGKDCRKQNVCYDVRLYRMGDVKRFHDLIGFSIGRKNRKLESIICRMKSNPSWNKNQLFTSRYSYIFGGSDVDCKI